MPRSVIRPVTSRAGVTSNAGLAAGVSGGLMHLIDNAIGAPALDPGDFFLSPFFDGDLCNAVINGPVNGRGRQRDIEGHIVVARGEGLQIGADLVAHVATRRGAVRTGDNQINQTMLHQMSAGIVDDQRVRHAMLAKFPGGEARPLIAWTRFVDKDMHLDPGVMGLIDR